MDSGVETVSEDVLLLLMTMTMTTMLGMVMAAVWWQERLLPGGLCVQPCAQHHVCSI